MQFAFGDKISKHPDESKSSLRRSRSTVDICQTIMIDFGVTRP